MAQNKAEDVAGLAPGKNDNAVMGQLTRQTPRNLDWNCCRVPAIKERMKVNG